MLVVGRDGEAGAERHGLFCKQRDIAIARDCDDVERVPSAQLRYHVERVDTDRAGRPENADAASIHVCHAVSIFAVAVGLQVNDGCHKSARDVADVIG
ncbi:hypothetical protein D3C71_1623290 [compost metagenome]